MIKYLFAIIIAIIAIGTIKGKNKQSNNKLDEMGRIFNIVLSVLYIPLSFFSIIMGLFIWDSPLKNELDKTIRTIVTYVSIPMPLICITSIVLSTMLRKKRMSKLSFCMQFLPIALFILNILALTIPF